MVAVGEAGETTGLVAGAEGVVCRLIGVVVVFWFSAGLLFKGAPTAISHR